MLHVLNPAPFGLDIDPVPLSNPLLPIAISLYPAVAQTVPQAPAGLRSMAQKKKPSSDNPDRHHRRHRRHHADHERVEPSSDNPDRHRHRHRTRRHHADHERVEGDKHAGDAQSKHTHRRKHNCEPESALKRLASDALATQTYVIVVFEWEPNITDCNLPRHPTFKPWFMMSNQKSFVCNIYVFDVFLHICWVAHFNFIDLVSHTCNVCMMFIVLAIRQI